MVDVRLRALIGGALVLVGALSADAADAQRAVGADQEVVVTGVRSKLSDWREAETSHVIVQSDGQESELIRLTRNLERLHFLLNSLMSRSDTDDAPLRIRITLVSDVAIFQNMGLRNWRWQQGPFNAFFGIGRYYDPREDGAVMASTRIDQRTVIEHTMVNAETAAQALRSTMPLAHAGDNSNSLPMLASINDLALSGMRSEGDTGPTFGEKAIEVSAEGLLYAGYAQHYLLTYFPAAYPRWYLDGFGQIFSSFAAPKENVVEFGRVPVGTRAVLDEFGSYPIKDVLNDAYLSQDPHKTHWTPVHAWMLTHFLFFSDTRRPQLRQYLTARANGVDADQAAAIFGDPVQLARELRDYHSARKPYYQVTYDASKIEQPLVRRLRESEAAFVQGRLELGARVTIPPAPDGASAPARAQTKARADALAARDRWLERLRRDAAKWPNDVGAHLLLAEAECRSGNPASCLVEADRALALAPANTGALAWKGLAMAQQAAALPASDRQSMLAAARSAILQANHADPDAVRPLLAYYESFAAVGEPPTTGVIDAMQRAVEEVPSAPVSRLDLANALAGRGQTDAARKVILPVAIGAYDTPEKGAADALLKRLEQPAAAADAGSPAQLKQP